VKLEEKDKLMSGDNQNGFNRKKYHEEVASGDSAVVEAPPKPNTSAGRKAGEVTSWDAYRNWLTKVQAPEQRRSLPDPALFSFKGYRSWAEKVRRDWDHDE
jgi:hypothetical protein